MYADWKNNVSCYKGNGWQCHYRVKQWNRRENFTKQMREKKKANTDCSWQCRGECWGLVTCLMPVCDVLPVFHVFLISSAAPRRCLSPSSTLTPCLLTYLDRTRITQCTSRMSRRQGTSWPLTVASHILGDRREVPPAIYSYCKKLAQLYPKIYLSLYFLQGTFSDQQCLPSHSKRLRACGLRHPVPGTEHEA